MVNESADRTARLIAGLIALAGTILLAVAVRQLHQEMFSHPGSGSGIATTPGGVSNFAKAERGYPKERIMTDVAIAALSLAAFIILVADIVLLTDPGSEEDEP